MRGNGVAEFYFRQYLFACQARLLFKLNRPTEVPAVTAPMYGQSRSLASKYVIILLCWVV